MLINVHALEDSLSTNADLHNSKGTIIALWTTIGAIYVFLLFGKIYTGNIH